ncbi:MAG: GFA family protein [Lysobacter sp.]|nr:GFA family protein [Lysobacter sp.]MDQ3269470.1 GFA family protein [Pseudomonadota bacterium]
MPDDSFIPLQGGCLCGAVRYRLLSPPTDSGYCHCRICRRAAGAPLLLFATVPKPDMEIVRGTPKHYRSSPSGERWFCGDCGTQLYMQVESEPDTTDFTVASLDTPETVPPTFHIWHGSRIAWFDTADALELFPRGRTTDP